MVAVNYLGDDEEDNIIREYDDAGATLVEYTTEPELYGNVISQNRGGTTSYLHFDGQGNTTELTNSAGVVTDRIRYTAFGEITERTGTTEIRFQYVGRNAVYREGSLDVYLVRWQPMAPDAGRWLNATSVARRCNYAYAANHPTAILLSPTALLPRRLAGLTSFSGFGFHSTLTNSDDYTDPDFGDLPESRRFRFPFPIVIPIPVEVRRRYIVAPHCGRKADGTPRQWIPNDCHAITWTPLANDGPCVGGEHVYEVDYDPVKESYVFIGKCIKCEPTMEECKETGRCAPCRFVSFSYRTVAPFWGGGNREAHTYRVERHKWFCRCLTKAEIC